MLLAQIRACLWSMSQPRNVTTGINTNIFFTIYQDVQQFCFLMLNHAALVTLKGYQ